MNIQERRNKDGKITSYRIRVFNHRDTDTGKQVFKNLSVKYDSTKSESWNRKNAEKQADGIVKKAREDAAEILARAEEDAARMKRAAVDELKDDIADLAVQVAERVLGDAVPKNTLRASAKKYTDEITGSEVKVNE